MKVSHADKDGVGIFRLEGHLDSTTSGTLQAALMPAAQVAACRIAVDLSQVEYVSSAGLRIILMAAKQARASGGDITLFGLTNWVRETFEISGFTRIIAIVDTEADAIGAVRP